MQALPILRIEIPRVCGCDQNSEYCTMCPRKYCIGNRDCQHCSEEIRTMQELVDAFRCGIDGTAQGEVLQRKCEFAKEAPAFFASHPSARNGVQQLLGFALGSFELVPMHDVFRDTLLFLRRLRYRSDWR